MLQSPAADLEGQSPRMVGRSDQHCKYSPRLCGVSSGRSTELRVRRFDLQSWDFEVNEIEKVEDEKGMLESTSALNMLITAEVDSGTDPSRIVLGGFSQGGAPVRQNCAGTDGI